VLRLGLDRQLVVPFSTEEVGELDLLLPVHD
jgi:hypothetical protein